MSPCDWGEPGAESIPGARFWCKTRATVQTWLPGNPVIPGDLWCWEHVKWVRKGDKCPFGGATAA